MKRNCTLIARSVVVGFIGYTIAVFPLNLISPTDYPHQPGDGYRNAVKAYCAALVGWFCAKDWYKQQLKKKSSEENSPPTK